MKLKILPTPIEGLLVLQPKVHGDARGFFMESFNDVEFEAATGQQVGFVQDNHSYSTRGVLRGLHFQVPPRAQGKLVRVTRGEVFDVAVDLRPGSATFGRWHAERLDAVSHRQLWIPCGFAHGFMVLSDTADFLYKTTDYYSPEHERSIRWDDPDLAIAWPTGTTPQVSARDRDAPFWSDVALTLQ